MTADIVEFPDRSVVEEAAAWLIRLDGDETLGPAELEQFRKWLQASEEHRRELTSLARTWDKMNVMTELAIPLDRRELEPHAPRRFAGVWAAGLAATLILAFAWVTSYRLESNDLVDPMLSTNGSYVADVGKQRVLPLVDGSTVILNTDSLLEVDYNKDYRNVYLVRGEAHFTVAPNDEQPFRVYAGKGRVQAVGTAFSVYLRANDLDVTVTEGSVKLAKLEHAGALPASSGPNANGAVATVGAPYIEAPGELTAGQRTTIIQAAAQAGLATEFGDIVQVDEKALAQQLSWRDGILMYSGESLEDVVADVSRYTTLSIEFSDPAVRALRIGGRFPIGETDVLLETLESSFGLQVTRVDDESVLLSLPDR